MDTVQTMRVLSVIASFTLVPPSMRLIRKFTTQRKAISKNTRDTNLLMIGVFVFCLTAAFFSGLVSFLLLLRHWGVVDFLPQWVFNFRNLWLLLGLNLIAYGTDHMSR